MKERSVRPPTNSSPKREGGNLPLLRKYVALATRPTGAQYRGARGLPGASRSRRRSRTNWAATGAILMSPSVPSEGTVRATRRWLPHPP